MDSVCWVLAQRAQLAIPLGRLQRKVLGTFLIGRASGSTSVVSAAQKVSYTCRCNHVARVSYPVERYGGKNPTASHGPCLQDLDWNSQPEQSDDFRSDMRTVEGTQGTEVAA